MLVVLRDYRMQGARPMPFFTWLVILALAMAVVYYLYARPARAGAAEGPEPGRRRVAADMPDPARHTQEAGVELVPDLVPNPEIGRAPAPDIFPERAEGAQILPERAAGPDLFPDPDRARLAGVTSFPFPAPVGDAEATPGAPEAARDAAGDNRAEEAGTREG